MNEVRLNHIIRPRTVPGESGRVVFFGSVLLVIDMRHCANGNTENAVGGGGYSSCFHLATSSRKVQERRRVIVTRADNKRDFVFFLEVVEFLSKFGKFIE